MTANLKGNRRADTVEGDMPSDVARGDYWKSLGPDGQPLKSDSPSNLTGTIWYVAAPIDDSEGFALGRLVNHTVREHEDHTISVRPGDGSSNSILITGSKSWHGYIERGEWRAA